MESVQFGILENVDGGVARAEGNDGRREAQGREGALFMTCTWFLENTARYRTRG